MVFRKNSPYIIKKGMALFEPFLFMEYAGSKPFVTYRLTYCPTMKLSVRVPSSEATFMRYMPAGNSLTS